MQPLHQASGCSMSRCQRYNSRQVASCKHHQTPPLACCTGNPWLCTPHAMIRQLSAQQQRPRSRAILRAAGTPPELPTAVKDGLDFAASVHTGGATEVAAPAELQQEGARSLSSSSSGSSSSSSSSSSIAGQAGPELGSKESLAQRLHGCPQCQSKGRVACKECEGRGFLKRGGYMKKNPPLNMNRIIGSKWTAMEETMGWRHFRVIQQRKLDKHTPFLLLQASCDPSVQIWVNAQTLRDRPAWAAGWLQMSEIQGLGLEVQGRGLKCQACCGLGYKPCLSCDGTGRAQLIVL